MVTLGSYQSCKSWMLEIRLPWKTEKGHEIRDVWPASREQEMPAAAWAKLLNLEWKEFASMVNAHPGRFIRTK